jgi:hypothetical protein
MKIRNDTYLKDWVLLTYKELKNSIKKTKSDEDYMKKFWEVEKGNFGNYPIKVGSTPKITNMDYLESITWVSHRTMAALNMPCSNCGTRRKSSLSSHQTC